MILLSHEESTSSQPPSCRDPERLCLFFMNRAPPWHIPKLAKYGASLWSFHPRKLGNRLMPNYFKSPAFFQKLHSNLVLVLSICNSSSLLSLSLSPPLRLPHLHVGTSLLASVLAALVLCSAVKAFNRLIVQPSPRFWPYLALSSKMSPPRLASLALLLLT